MILSSLVFRNFDAAVLYPLILGGISVLASLVASMVIKISEGGGIMAALYRGLAVAGVLAAAAFYWVTKNVMAGNGLYPEINIFLASLIGLVVTGLLVWITEYYTGTNHKPVQAIAQASTTGHGTNIIAGLAVSMRSTVWPVLVIAAAILGAYALANLFGVAVAAMAMLSMAGI